MYYGVMAPLAYRFYLFGTPWELGSFLSATAEDPHELVESSYAFVQNFGNCAPNTQSNLSAASGAGARSRCLPSF